MLNISKTRLLSIFFHPEHFAAKVEMSVRDLSAETLDLLAVQFGDQVAIRNGIAEFVARHYTTAAKLGMAPASAWEGIPLAPAAMDYAKAKSMLENEHVVRSYNGDKITLNAQTITHFAGKGDSNVNDRLRMLPRAELTIKDPDEHWMQEDQSIMLKAFKNNKGQFRGVFVAIKPSGTVHTYFVNQIKEFERARKGKFLIYAKKSRANGGASPTHPNLED